VYGSKQSLLTYILLFIIFRGTLNKNLVKMLLITFIFTLLAWSFLLQFYDDLIVNHLYSILERAIVSPGLVASVTWDYISNNYIEDSISYSVGSMYFQDGTNASTNLFMFGFAQLNLVGGIIVSILAGLLIGICKIIPGPNFYPLGTVSACIITFIWTEQNLHTSILSSGVLVLYVTLLMLKTKTEHYKF